MIKPLVKDVMQLSRKATPASRADLPAVQDLLDTLQAHSDSCVGMAGNMIGVNKKILVFAAGPLRTAMINPKLIAHSEDCYEAEEGCLCLEGTRKTMRFSSITVEYQDMQFRKQTRSFSGFTAQIIQHEMDHFNGTLI